MWTRKNNLKVVVAIVFWILLIAIHFIRVVPFFNDGNDALSIQIRTWAITFSLDAITFVLFYFWLIPAIIENRKRTLVIIVSLVHWCFYGFVWGWVYIIFGRVTTDVGFMIIFKSSIGHTFLYTLYALVLHLSVDWYYKRQHQKQLEAENALIKLSMLKAQINPHFLFNVLNNIHSLVHKNAVKTADSIIKLSEIMRYMLYESDQSNVPLDREIEHIRNYLKLQELRLIEKESVQFDVEGITKEIEIAPLIFIAFIENAFKHGKKNQKDSILMRIIAGEDDLHFYCSNLVRKLSRTEEESFGSRIGLDNIKRRLQLLYPDRHTLTIEHNDIRFDVHLEIKLK